MKVLIIDNYDSFTFNLYQYVGEILYHRQDYREHDIRVIRNDELNIEDIRKLNPQRIIISPGPGSPMEKSYFGICTEVIIELGKSIPVMGVCLGMQGIAYCFGANIIRAPLPMHGKVSCINHDGIGLYQGIPQNLEVMRYHSLMVEPSSLPECLSITSIVSDQGRATVQDFKGAALNGNEIMGIRHKVYPIEGIQFHPESFATEGGQALLYNFLK